MKIQQTTPGGSLGDVVQIGLGGTLCAAFTMTTSEVLYTKDIVTANNTGGLLIYNTVGTASVFTVDDVTVKEVGVATGWTTADAEPLIPQTALMGMSKPMVFDGVDNVVSMGDQSELDITTGDFSISWWMVKTSSGTTQRLVTKYGAPGWTIRKYSNEKINTYIRDDTTANAEIITASALSSNKLYHIVCSFDRSSDCKIYINGSLDVTTSISALDGNTLDNTSDFVIGGTNSQEFNGILGEVSMWSTALSITEVQELYNDGVALDATLHSKAIPTGSGTDYLEGYWRNDGASTWTDRSQNSNPGTPAGSPDTILLPEGTTSGKDILGFPLTDTNNGWLNISGREYVKIDDASVFHLGEKNFTFELWAKFNETSTTRGFFTYWKDANNRYQLSDYGTIDFFVDVGGTDDTAQVSNTRNLDWHHYAVVKKGSTVKIYIDTSVVVTEASWNAAISNISFTGGTLYLGTRTDDGSDLTSFCVSSSFDEFKIYHKALSAAEVLKNYKHGKGKHPN